MTWPEDDDLDTLEKTFVVGGGPGRGKDQGVDSVPAPVDPASGSLGAPISFDRYHLKRGLGKGAMGEVHLCKDSRIGRDVAMKIILPTNQTDAQARARFIREARVQGQLEHPSIVPVYDLGVDAGGSIFFTMKCLRGMTLAQIIRGLKNGDAQIAHAYPRRRLLSAFAAACLAVDFAHSRGVIHRDLKPANIMLGDFGEVYVLDWGIAKLRDDAPGAPVEDPLEEDIHTAADSILGTFGYMSPEQALGRAMALDARSDVYSLGATLFEVLTLEALHPRNAWNAMLRSTLAGAHAKTSERAPHRDIPPELEAICVKATLLHPDQRYASARELHDAVESFLDGDRDLSVRSQLASRYARAAEVAAGKAAAGGPGSAAARRDALREVARALALDPANIEATAALGRVVLAPPAELPDEVVAEVAAQNGRRRRMQLREGIRANVVAMGLLLPFGLWMGIRNVVVFVASLLLTGLATAFQLIALRVEDRRPAHDLIYAAFVSNVLSMICIGRAFGPLILVPMVLAVLTFGYCMSYEDKYRRAVIITAGLATLFSIVLEWSGVVGRSYEFRDGAMIILPNAVSMSETPTLVGLTVASIFFVVVPGLFMDRLQKALRKAEQRSSLHVWHLRQLLPVQEAAVTDLPVDSQGRRF